MFQKKPNSSWLPGRVVEIGDTLRSYIVEGEEVDTEEIKFIFLPD